MSDHMFFHLIFKMVRSRAGRVVLGVLMVGIAALVAVQGYMEQHVATVSGKPAGLSAYKDQNSGAVVYDELQLSGSSTLYKLHEGDFSPALTDVELQDATSLDLWYTSSPLAGTWAIAVQMHDAHGHVTRATTSDYPTPADRGSYKAATVIGGLAVLIILSGVFLPDIDLYGRKRKVNVRQPAAGQGWQQPPPYPADPYSQTRYQPGGEPSYGRAGQRYGEAPPVYGRHQQQSYEPPQPPTYGQRPPQPSASGWPQPGPYQPDGGPPPYDNQWDQGQDRWGTAPRR